MVNLEWQDFNDSSIGDENNNTDKVEQPLLLSVVEQQLLEPNHSSTDSISASILHQADNFMGDLLKCYHSLTPWINLEATAVRSLYPTINLENQNMVRDTNFDFAFFRAKNPYITGV